MLNNYLIRGLAYLIYTIPIAFIAFLIYTAVKYLLRKKIEVKPLNMLCEFLWILTVLAILRITGIIGGNFSTSTISNEMKYFSLGLFEEGLSMAMLLNIVLFIPFGFFSPITFKKLQKKWYYTILTGLSFSIVIEFLQIFTGRFVQLDDVLMNTLGTFLGYGMWFLLFHKSKTKNTYFK